MKSKYTTRFIESQFQYHIIFFIIFMNLNTFWSLFFIIEDCLKRNRAMILYNIFSRFVFFKELNFFIEIFFLQHTYFNRISLVYFLFVYYGNMLQINILLKEICFFFILRNKFSQKCIMQRFQILCLWIREYGTAIENDKFSRPKETFLMHSLKWRKLFQKLKSPEKTVDGWKMCRLKLCVLFQEMIL